MGTSGNKKRVRAAPKKKMKYWVFDREKWWFLEDDYAIAKLQCVNHYWWGTVMPRKIRHIGPYKDYADAMRAVEKFVYKLNATPHSWEDDDGLSEAALRDTPKQPTTLCGLRKGQSGYGFENH